MTDPEFRFWTDRDLEHLPQLEWLVDGIIPKGGLSVLYGPSGVGKSFVGLSWMVSIAHGESWLGREVRCGHVVYIAAEGVAGLPSRIAALKQWHRITRVKALTIVPDPVYLHNETVLAAYLSQLLEHVQGPIALTVVDTLSRCSAGSNENSNAEREVTVEGLKHICRVTKGAVLAIHHTGWNESRMRGGSALQAAADCVLALRRAGAGLELKVEKHRDSEAGAVFPLDLTPFHGGVVVVSGQKQPGALSRNQRHALEILKAHGAVDGMSTKRWLELTEMAESSFHEARRRLVEDRYVSAHGKGWYVVSRANAEGLQFQAGSETLQAGAPNAPLQCPLSKGTGDGEGKTAQLDEDKELSTWGPQLALTSPDHFSIVITEEHLKFKRWKA